MMLKLSLVRFCILDWWCDWFYVCVSLSVSRSSSCLTLSHLSFALLLSSALGDHDAIALTVTANLELIYAIPLPNTLPSLHLSASHLSDTWLWWGFLGLGRAFKQTSWHQLLISNNLWFWPPILLYTQCFDSCHESIVLPAMYRVKMCDIVSSGVASVSSQSL